MVFHIDVDVLPSSCKECFVKGRHCAWAVRVISLAWWGISKIPMDATVFCRFVTSCIVTCQISHHSVWEDSQNPSPTQLPPILPELSAHDALKIIKQLVTEVVLSLTLHQIIPPRHPLRSPPAVSGDPGLGCPQHPRRRPPRGAAPPRRCGPCQPPSAAVSDLRRRRARRRQRLEGSTPWLSTAHPHCSGRNCNLWSEVREFHLLQNCIASWLNGSHYLLLLFVKITKTTNWWNLPKQKIRKRENRFMPNKLSFISTYLEHSQALFHTHAVGPYR